MKSNKYLKPYGINLKLQSKISLSFQTNHIIPPNIVTDFICRYHTRITGVKPKPHTEQFILQELHAVYGLYDFSMIKNNYLFIF
jgi:hypothetical protein